MGSSRRDFNAPDELHDGGCSRLRVRNNNLKKLPRDGYGNGQYPAVSGVPWVFGSGLELCRSFYLDRGSSEAD